MPIDPYTASQAQAATLKARNDERGASGFEAKYGQVVDAIKAADSQGANYVQHSVSGFNKVTVETIRGLLLDPGNFTVNVTKGDGANSYIFDIWW